MIGTIVTPKLMVEEGAYLEANCQTTDKMPQSALPLTSPEEKPEEKKEKEDFGPKP